MGRGHRGPFSARTAGSPRERGENSARQRRRQEGKRGGLALAVGVPRRGILPASHRCKITKIPRFSCILIPWMAKRPERQRREDGEARPPKKFHAMEVEFGVFPRHGTQICHFSTAWKSLFRKVPRHGTHFCPRCPSSPSPPHPVNPVNPVKIPLSPPLRPLCASASLR